MIKNVLYLIYQLAELIFLVLYMSVTSLHDTFYIKRRFCPFYCRNVMNTCVDVLLYMTRAFSLFSHTNMTTKYYTSNGIPKTRPKISTASQPRTLGGNITGMRQDPVSVMPSHSKGLGRRDSDKGTRMKGLG